MYQSKWISDLSAVTPVADAARRVLMFRLEGVRDCLGLALREPVGTRVRASTAGSHAAGVGGPGNLRRMPSSEGLPHRAPLGSQHSPGRPARPAIGTSSWGVFIDDAENFPADDRAALDMLVGYALAHRLPAQEGHRGIVPRLPLRLRALHGRDHRRHRFSQCRQDSPGQLRPAVAGPPVSMS